MNPTEAIQAADETVKFIQAGCELTKPLQVFMSIYALSGGKPCEGCNYDMGGRCEARKKLFPSAKKETVRHAFRGQPGLAHNEFAAYQQRRDAAERARRKPFWNCRFCQAVNPTAVKTAAGMLNTTTCKTCKKERE